MMGSAEVACVPSLYEGFSLPTAELMACETPLVVSRAGAIPEVVGADGECADLVTPGDVGELEQAIAALLDDPERRARMGRAGRRRVLETLQLARRGRGDRSGVRTRGRQLASRQSRPPTPRRGDSMLTVDFDRLGLRPGDRVLDMGCGAGRHAFEMYRRGADVIAFDQDADELAGVLDLFAAMREAGEVPVGAEADVKQGDALSLPFADGEFDRVVASEVLEHIPADDPGDRGARPGAATRRHDGRHRAALAAGEGLLGALRRLPRGRGRPRPHLHRRRAGREAGSAGHGVRRQGPRPRPALAVLVDQVRGRRRQRRATRW